MANEGNPQTLNKRIEDLVDDLETRLTAARAALLDELDPATGGKMAAEVDVLLTRLSAVRAGYLDNLSAGAVAQASVATEPRLAELDAANLPADIDTLKTRIPGTVQPQTGDSFARLGAPVGASISADIADVEGKVDDLETRIPGVVQPQTGDSFARLGAPAGASVSADVADVKSAILAVQNNTRFVAAVNPKIHRPAAGSEAMRVPARLYDSTGALEDPDDNEIAIRIVKVDGTFITDRLFTTNALSVALSAMTDQTAFPTASGWVAMVRSAAGEFVAFYKNSSTDTEETLVVEFGAEEAAVKTTWIRSTDVTDAADLDTIDSKVATLHDTRIPGVVQPQTGDSFARLGAPAGASIAADLADIESKVDDLETRIPGTVQAQTGDSFARLGAPAGASVSADIAALQTSINTVDDFVDTEVAAIKNAVGTWTNDNRATVSCPASTETDLIANVTITTPTRVLVHVDLTNLTVAATINVYEDGGSAGTTLTKIDPSKSWATTDNDIVVIEFWALADYKVTITTGAEGANRDVYVRHSRQVTA